MAAKVQKTTAETTTTTSTVFFGCGDILSLNNSSEKAALNEHHAVKHSTILERDSMDSQDNFDHINESLNSSYPRIHNVLSRTISQPQPPMVQGASKVSALVTPLIEDFGNINLHRKLERTQSEPLPQLVNTSRYKTELCRPFEEAGECKYGEKCQFAHGYHELRNLQRHPKYKTEYCRTFHSVGFCPYGPRCHFVHNADEVRSSQQQSPQQQQQQEQQPQQQHNNLTAQQQNCHQSRAAAATANNLNNCLTNFGLSGVASVVAAVAGAHQQQQQQQQHNINSLSLGLPITPPLSMSTGSDRESPTGSLSISPTNSMTCFPFGDQIFNQTGDSAFQTSNINNFGSTSYNITPPQTPNAPLSPVSTPPPSADALQMQYIEPAATSNLQGRLLLQKSSSSPIAIASNKNVIVGSGAHKTLYKMNSALSLNSDGETRLPVFNRLSSSPKMDL